MQVQNFVEELRWRGMLAEIMPGTEERLMQGPTAGYIGFDPTGDSLGVGNMVQIMTLLHFQNCGHKPIALVGGATGMVGDPSGKSAERNLLDIDVLNHNIACQKKQLEKFLDFSNTANGAELVNNFDWFKDFKFLDFIREVGKHISINYMIAKDSVQTRLEKGLSFTEFSYQLIQGYDFYYLWKHKGVMLQMGGSDQWGNITTGNELIRRMAGGEAFALCTPLIKKADGTKFGKTESGNIWLDAKRTSPYKFYQFWLNASDADAENYIKIFTLFSRAETEEIIAAHLREPHLRNLQKTLAKDITCRVHSESEYIKAKEASEILFGKSTAEALKTLDEQTLLDVFEGVPSCIVSRDKFVSGISITDLLTAESQFIASKSELRRAIQENSLSANRQKITDGDTAIHTADLINEKYLVVQRGKKNYFLIIAE